MHPRADNNDDDDGCAALADRVPDRSHGSALHTDDDDDDGCCRGDLQAVVTRQQSPVDGGAKRI